MKIRITLIALFIAGCIFLAFPKSAAATPPDTLTIDVDMWVTGENSAAGTFTISGVVADSGVATETFFMADDTSHGVKTLVSAQGTITIKYQVQLTWTPDMGIAQGRYTIINGTGAYARLHGVGTTYATLDLSTGHLLANYTGTAHID
ncbi:MAG: hypothetical protein FIA98_10030 [Anaerolineae bacterium]|nr:hypothetical protein [Anaerolineae bacterium]